MLLQEARYNIWTKGEGDTTVVFTPAGDVFIRVGPEQIAEKTAVGDVGRAHNTSDLLHRVEVGAQATVHGEDLLINDGGDGQAVEAVGESLPKLDVIASLALVVETVDTVDGSALVVTTENEEVLGVLDLVSQQKADGLERLLATVDVVTEEEVVGLGREATVLEETEKVVVLAVNITADLDRRLELEEDGLGDENLAGLGAKGADLGLEELDLLAGTAAANFKKTVYDGVEIDIVWVRHLWR